MIYQTTQDTPLIYVIPRPRVSKYIAIVAATFFLLFAAFIPSMLILKFGFYGFFAMFMVMFSFEGLGVWFITIFSGATSAFFFWLAFPHRNVLARLEIEHSRIRIVPGRFKNLFVEQFIDIPLVPQPREIIFCHCYYQGLHDGCRMIIGRSDGSDREIRHSSLQNPDPVEFQKIGATITSATGIPVRLVTRHRLANGTVQETPWRPKPRKELLRATSTLTIRLLPFVGGSIIGKIMPNAAVIVLVGLVLWLVQIFAAIVITTPDGSKRKHPSFYLLTTVISFASLYMVSIVAMAYIFHSQ